MNNPKKTFKSISRFQNRQMLQFLVQVDLQLKALGAIKNILPEALAAQAIACVIKENKLLIYTHSAAWASQLRFYSRELQSSVSSIIQQPIDKVQIRILQGLSPKTKEHSDINIPSFETIERIQSYALSSGDNKLKTALLKLSQTLRRRHEEHCA